jgi:S-adenosylmethionine:diacylglycerol 3-amino-3-carboxypropyl transferase
MKLLTEVNRKLKRFHTVNMQAVCMHKELLNKEKYVKSKMEKLGKG